MINHFFTSIIVIRSAEVFVVLIRKWSDFFKIANNIKYRISYDGFIFRSDVLMGIVNDKMTASSSNSVKYLHVC